MLNTYSAVLLISSPPEPLLISLLNPLAELPPMPDGLKPSPPARTPNLVISWDNHPCQAASPGQLPSRPLRGGWWHGIVACNRFRRHLSRAYYCSVNVDVLQESAFELNTELVITEFLQNGAISTPQFPYSYLSVKKSNDQQCAPCVTDDE